MLLILIISSSGGLPEGPAVSFQNSFFLFRTHLQCVMTLEHGAPVEATVFLPGGSMLATAGGTEIR